MAIRIYDQTVGQLAGVVITTTGKGQIKNDGTEAFAQLVVPVDESGDPIAVGLLDDANVRINPATEDTLSDVYDVLSATPVSIPPQVPVASDDTTFTYVEISEAALNGAATIVSASEDQSTRIHGLFLTLSAAVAETLVEFRSGTTVLGSAKVPATPNQLVIDRRSIEYWLFKTANNETFNINTGAAVNVYGDAMYVKGA